MWDLLLWPLKKRSVRQFHLLQILGFVSQQTYAGSDAPEEGITYNTRLTVLAAPDGLQLTSYARQLLDALGR